MIPASQLQAGMVLGVVDQSSDIPFLLETIPPLVFNVDFYSMKSPLHFIVLY